MMFSHIYADPQVPWLPHSLRVSQLKRQETKASSGKQTSLLEIILGLAQKTLQNVPRIHLPAVA